MAAGIHYYISYRKKQLLGYHIFSAALGVFKTLLPGLYNTRLNFFHMVNFPKLNLF